MRRIQRAQDKDTLIQQLTVGEDACFGEIWRLMLFCATLGFKLKRREPLGHKDSGKAVMESYFANSPVWPGVLYLFALVESGDTAGMQSSEAAENAILTVFEEYANGGLAYLNEQLHGRQPNLLNVLDIVNGVITQKPATAPSLSDITI